ncbi:DNA cytosine methyltransferase [Alicycliphilus denitrificans]|uniref:DNA cytosine methyltransferase n=1 Tax=Alicycliphilus denitrificans TaxID=179636 RepID=UPI003A80D4A7
MSKLEVVDLFCGAGGLSLGAARAGFSLAAGVELDRHAHETHALNFPSSKSLQLDVGKLSGSQLHAAAGVPVGALGGLIGGPPCQGFSSMGRKDPNDARNDLFGHFMRLVAETQPAFFLAENVPGILLKKNAAPLKKALKNVPNYYHMLSPLEVDASLYGAPTNRTRVFFIGVDGRRLPALHAQDFAPVANVRSVCVKEALEGLTQQVDPRPPPDEHVWTKVGDLPTGVFYTRVQNRIPKGVGNLAAIARYKTAREVSGHIGTLHAPEIAARYGELAPGAKDAISRSVRLKSDGFCHTLRAGTGPEKGSYQAVRPIHPTEPRVITPREAARLQGFPDWFLLPPTKWHSFRQIGNSVSPLVAEAMLTVLYRHLEKHLLLPCELSVAA